jgi:SAM-dependent methyltransferase
MEATAANARAAAASSEASKSNEATSRAKGEAYALREALAHAGQALKAEVEQRHREVAQRHREIGQRDREIGQRDQEIGQRDQEIGQRDDEVARLRAEVIAAKTEAARLRYDLDAVYASRSWRLGRPYRTLGVALQRLRGGGRPSPQDAHVLNQPGGSVQLLNQSPLPERVPMAPAEEQSQVEDDPSSRWPIWLDDNTFVTERFTYTMSKDQFEGLTENGTVALLKDRKFVELYRDLMNELQPQRILEIGYFQGGMPLFLADLLAPEKVVAIDYMQPSEALKTMIADAGLQNSVKLHGGILQADTSTLRQLVDGEFADRQLDLIIDDASHEYENSRVCFQDLFGYLRPGGKYVIEDWGWLHWPGEEWQTARSHFWKKPAMTNLIFELVMTLGSHHPKIISRIDVLSWACVVVTRGEGLAHGEPIDLSATRLTGGRRFQPL